MKNIYNDIYPNANWDYTYECPQCSEPVPLEIDPESCPFARELKGRCQNCHLDISITEDAFNEWELNQRGELSQKQEDYISEPHRHQDEEGNRL